MKKILSIILALAMLISLVPAAFANDTETQTYSGVKVEYNMITGPGYDYNGKTNTNFTSINTLEQTNGFWCFHSKSGIGGIEYRNASAFNMKAYEGDWFALAINVPKAGKYNVSFGYLFEKIARYGADQADVWILSSINKATNAEYTKDEITAATLNDDPITSIDCYNAETNKDKGLQSTEAEPFYFAEAGTYLVVFKCIKPAANRVEIDKLGHIKLGKIILNGNGDEVVPMSFPVSIDKTELVLGGAAADATAQITLGNTATYMSNGEAATIGSVSYTSSNGNVDVNSNGLVTAKAAGPATITATATVTTSSNTYTASTSMDINVVSDEPTVEPEATGITLKYSFITGPGYNYKDSEDSFDFRTINTLERTNGFWRFHSQSGNSQIAYRNASAFQMKTSEGEWVALEINVPEPGDYDVSFGYLFQKLSYIPVNRADVWILPSINEATDAEYTKDEIGAALIDGEEITSIDCCNEVGNQNVAAVQNTTPVNVNFPNAGTYLVVFKCIEATIGRTDGKGYIMLNSITLDGDGDKTNLIPMSLAASLDKTEIVIGSATDSTAQMSAPEYYMSDGSAVTNGFTVSYTSSAPQIATVDANGLISAVASGTATITASTTVDGYTLSRSKDITVIQQGVSVTYNIGTDQRTKKDSGFLTALTKDYTNGFYRFYGENSVDYDGNVSAGSLYSREGGLQVNDNNVTVSFEVYIPEKGNYTMQMKNNVSTRGGRAEVWLGTAENISLKPGAEVLGTKVGTYVCFADIKANTYPVPEEPSVITGIEINSPGWYVFSFTGDSTYRDPIANEAKYHIYVGDFTLTNGKGKLLPMSAVVKMDKATIVLDGTADISGAVQYFSDGTTVKAESNESTTYASSNSSVATVNGSTITAIGVGTADITATIGDGVTATSTITVVDKIATDEVSSVQFMATSTIANNAGVTTNIDGYTVGSTTDAIAPGETVAVTANDVDGYIFRGWKRGSKDNGVWVSESKVYSFPLLTNTYLTAIYDVDTAEDADVNVEFYNFNGQFITSTAINGAGFGTLASGVSPTLTGYNSFFWTIDGENAVAEDKVFDKLTRVVAKFTDKDSFAVTVPTNVTSDKASDTYEYDTEIAMSADNAGVWEVNGKQVAYGTSFTYTVWSAATITFEEKANDGKPILSLDGNTTDGARMISYDANGATIVEAGILFGANATIESANSRAVSRKARGNVSGQFTAKPYSDADVDNATAYLIYNDNGTYRVIYAD